MSRLIADTALTNILRDSEEGEPQEEDLSEDELLDEESPDLWLGSRLITALFDGEYLSTFAPNTLGLTSFLSSGLIKTIRDNLAAIVLGATGAKHTADLTVSAGHKHDGVLTRLSRWRQIASWQFSNQAGSVVGSSPDECYDAFAFTSTSSVTKAHGRFWAQSIDAARIIPRIKVSHGNGTTLTCQVTVAFYRPDTMASLATQNITVTTEGVRNRQWMSGVAVDLSAAPADSDQSGRIPIVWRISGRLVASSAEPVAVHELQMGVMQ